jgi:hypothetical protein
MIAVSGARVEIVESAKDGAPRNYETIQDKANSEAWRVEAIGYENDGEVYSALFMGPKARERAEQYAAFKNQ